LPGRKLHSASHLPIFHNEQSGERGLTTVNGAHFRVQKPRTDEWDRIKCTNSCHPPVDAMHFIENKRVAVGEFSLTEKIKRVKP
jgi:hypothetical protein